MSDCSVCCETTTKCIQCPYCKFECCIPCVSTFLLGLSKDSHCMNCNKLWSREILLQVLPKPFVNGKYKLHRENILFEREKSLFPTLQPLIAHEKRIIEVKKLKNELPHEQIKNAINELNVMYHGVDKKIKKKKKVFIRKCPVDKCLGFLSSSWKCSLCKNCICKDCNEIGEHTCDPGAVETMKLLKDDTKPCPKCGEMIFKASGCSQMWCTSCHVVFDWNTMEIDTGVIHNPHYYDYQRLHGTLQRQPGECEFPLYYDFLVVLGDETGYIGKIHRLWNHLIRYLEQVQLADDMNLENRKKFMHGTISEIQFKSRIQRSEKAREKVRDVNSVLVMFRDVLHNLLVDLLHRNIKFDEFKISIENIIVYTNDLLRKVKVLYDNSVMQFVDLKKMEMKYDSKIH